VDNSYRFFKNVDCEYFPCHKTDEPENFNCLFCYCPLYSLEDKCGGHFEYIGKDQNIKNCIDCILPHNPDYYDKVIGKLREANQ